MDLKNQKVNKVNRNLKVKVSILLLSVFVFLIGLSFLPGHATKDRTLHALGTDNAIVLAEDQAKDTASASGESDQNTEVMADAEVKSSKAWAAALDIGIPGLAGALAMGLAIMKAVESISKQPEAEGSIRSTLVLGLVFVETVVIYALVVGILIVFVL